MNRRVTIQDIADALGVSRNTVSKAINNSEGIADSTREKILQKAVEMGYKQFSYVSSLVSLSSFKNDTPEIGGEVAMLTSKILGKSHFASMMIDKIHEELAQIGYTLSFHHVSEKNVQSLTFPKTFHPDRIAAVICSEVFDLAYCDMICNSGIPVLFLDGPARNGRRSVNADMLMMDNRTEIMSFVDHMLERNLTKIGFIGDRSHCQSFWERHAAFRAAMKIAEVHVEDKFIIDYPDNTPELLRERITQMDEYPDVFICANDFVAIDAMRALAEKDRSLLKKVRFLGFDDSHESRIVYPALSTVHIHSQAMAFSALHLLMTRIKEPDMEYRTIYVETNLVLRESTEF
ncbi:MAG: LacI family DNA-binding transcriptional regulator [Solobacterium sp.]|nr:LacI family DNA-binding transcriptional regulator [Solobacterium sp.]